MLSREGESGAFSEHEDGRRGGAGDEQRRERAEVRLMAHESERPAAPPGGEQDLRSKMLREKRVTSGFFLSPLAGPA